MSKWSDVVDFVNNNKIFTKKEMRISLRITDSSNSTEGQYINHMLNSGFVKRLSRGKYEKIINIPNNITSNMMQKLGYNKFERDKLMKKLIITYQRKEKLKKLNDVT